jgi:CRP/FNR family cyclic AMP-dependent transcriptional regulator
LAARALCHSYPKHHVLFHEGEPARDVYLVLSGAIKVSLTDLQGHEVVLDDVRAGGLVGLISVMDNRPHPANAVAASRCRLARFDGNVLCAWLDEQPATRTALLHELALSVRHAYQRVREHALMTVRERLLHALLEIAEREGSPRPGGGEVVFKRPTHQELANRISASREMVSRMLKELVDDNLIAGEGDVLRITEPAMSRRYA